MRLEKILKITLLVIKNLNTLLESQIKINFYRNNTNLSDDALSNIGGLAGGLSALVTGVVTGLDNNEISGNVYGGQMIGYNAVKNNLTYVKPLTDKDGNNDKKYKVVYGDGKGKNEDNKDIYVVGDDVTKEDIKADEDKYKTTKLINKDTGKPYQTYSAGEFATRECNSGECILNGNLQVNVQGIGDDAVTNNSSTVLAVESQTGGAYDLKNTLVDLGYTPNAESGLVTTDDPNTFMNARTLGNYLYGVNAAAIGISKNATEFLADLYSKLTTNSLEEKKPIIMNGYSNYLNTYNNKNENYSNINNLIIKYEKNNEGTISLKIRTDTETNTKNNNIVINNVINK